MNADERLARKRQVVLALQAGQTRQAAIAAAGLTISTATASRWRRRHATHGEAGLTDGRHGHVAKFHPPLRAWIVAVCQETPHLSTPRLRDRIQTEWNLTVSLAHLNTVRAQLDVRTVRPRRKKKLAS